MTGTTTLVATPLGVRVFLDGDERTTELACRNVSSLAAGQDGTCLAIVDAREIWRRVPTAEWSHWATAQIDLQSLVAMREDIYCGGAAEAAIFSFGPGRRADRVTGFDEIPGRDGWFAQGPPLGVRSLAANANQSVLLAAVHVGGVPRSDDKAVTWLPTMPIEFDVHEVCAHPADSVLIAAATAVGLCVSTDAGKNWKVLSEGLQVKNSLAVTALDDEFLFSIADGPFARKSQLFRWTIGQTNLEQVREGLPEWLEGKIDTAQIAAARECAALIDGSGTLWYSSHGSRRWASITKGISYPSTVLIL